MNDAEATNMGTGAGDPNVAKTLGVGRGAGKKRLIKWLILALIVIGGAGGGYKWWSSRKTNSATTYKLEAVTKTDISVTITATGTVKGLNTVEVGAEVSGKVTKVHVDFNDRVKKGQVLAEIDPEQLKASMEEASARVQDASASIRQAKATLTEAKQNLARAEEQVKQGLISQRDVESARAAAARAEASVQSAIAGATLSQASLKSARTKLAKSTILSPIDGIVLARLVEPGQTVTAGFQTPVLFKLAEDLTRMSLNVYIDEADIGRAKEGQEATFAVDAFPERKFPSKLLSLRNEPTTDQNVVTYEAVLAVDNTALLLRPGMTATATIVAETRKDVVAVPNAALRFAPPATQSMALGRGGMPRAVTPKDGKKRTARVWVLEGLNPAERPVKTGASDGKWTEIIGDGVQPGTEVIVDAVEKK